MCGIAGIIGSGDASTIEAMKRVLRHRGPDGAGHFSRGETWVAATRLSILDPAAHAQPTFGSRGDACVVFNGEIYNHRELRDDLKRKGHHFTSGTDTEVVMRLYEEVGDACVEHLHGMFAFAVLDGDRVFLARDRLGIKPLYYALVPQTGAVVFASELKGLLQHRGLTPSLNVQALVDSLVIGYPAGDATFFEGIRSLLPGHTMEVRTGDGVRVREPRAYYSRAAARDEGMTVDEAEEMLGDELERAVRTHLDADTEVGVTLSGGLDSTLLAMLAARFADRPLRTFTVGDHPSYVDVVQAGEVARLVGSRHELVVPSFADYIGAIPGLVEAEEQPSSLYALPFHLLCRRAGAELKAVLHGEGADELFGGYSEYLFRDHRLAHIRSRLPVIRHLEVRPSDGALAAIDRLSKPATFDEYLPNVFEVNMADALERQHLAPVDKCGMAASLELRVPYLDDGMVALLKRVPLRHLVRRDLGVKKYLLRRLALHRFGLPILDVVLREKMGAPAAGAVLLDRFDRVRNETLPDEYVAGHPFGACFPAKRALLMFDLFTEVFMTHRGDSRAVGGVMDFLAERAGRTPRDTP